MRKSRCELVTEKGCHRCTVLGTPCSLQTTAKASTSYRLADGEQPGIHGIAPDYNHGRISLSREPSTYLQANGSPSANVQLQRTRSAAEEDDLQEIKQRTRDIQDMLKKILPVQDPPSQAFPSTMSMPTRQASVRTTGQTEESVIYGKTQQEGPIGFSVMTFGLASMYTYLDPIELGIVIPREMERAYHRQAYIATCREMFAC